MSAVTVELRITRLRLRAGHSLNQYILLARFVRFALSFQGRQNDGGTEGNALG